MKTYVCAVENVGVRVRSLGRDEQAPRAKVGRAASALQGKARVKAWLPDARILALLVGAPQDENVVHELGEYTLLIHDGRH